jgi:hypothetical protein
LAKTGDGLIELPGSQASICRIFPAKWLRNDGIGVVGGQTLLDLESNLLGSALSVI